MPRVVESIPTGFVVCCLSARLFSFFYFWHQCWLRRSPAGLSLRMERRKTFESDITRQMIRLSMTVEQLAKTSDELNQSVKKLTERVAN